MNYSRQRLKAREFDRDRVRDFGPDAKLLLLKTDGGAEKYATLETLAASWAPTFSDFFGPTTFKVAKSDAGFNANARKASYLVVIDSDNPAMNNELYVINRETTVPAGADPFWRLRATPNGSRYVPA